MKIDLNGRTAVIVGASGGLGEAMAHTLSGAGAKIALVGRNQTKLDKVHADLKAKGGVAETFTADFTNEDDVAKLAAAVTAKFSKPQILIRWNDGAVGWELVGDVQDAAHLKVAEYLSHDLFRCSAARSARGPKAVDAKGKFGVGADPTHDSADEENAGGADHQHEHERGRRKFSFRIVV